MTVTASVFLGPSVTLTMLVSFSSESQRISTLRTPARYISSKSKLPPIKFTIFFCFHAEVPFVQYRRYLCCCGNGGLATRTNKNAVLRDSIYRFWRFETYLWYQDLVRKDFEITRISAIFFFRWGEMLSTFCSMIFRRPSLLRQRLSTADS